MSGRSKKPPMSFWWHKLKDDPLKLDTILRAADGEAILAHSKQIKNNWETFKNIFDEDRKNQRINYYMYYDHDTQKTSKVKVKKDRLFYEIKIPILENITKMVLLVANLYIEERIKVPSCEGGIIDLVKGAHALGFKRLKTQLSSVLCCKIQSNSFDSLGNIYKLAKQIDDTELLKTIEEFFEGEEGQINENTEHLLKKLQERKAEKFKEVVDKVPQESEEKVTDLMKSYIYVQK